MRAYKDIMKARRDFFRDNAVLVCVLVIAKCLMRLKQYRKAGHPYDNLEEITRSIWSWLRVEATGKNFVISDHDPWIFIDYYHGLMYFSGKEDGDPDIPEFKYEYQKRYDLDLRMFDNRILFKYFGLLKLLEDQKNAPLFLHKFSMVIYHSDLIFRKCDCAGGRYNRRPWQPDEVYNKLDELSDMCGDAMLGDYD